jgi:hypothetical protein
LKTFDGLAKNNFQIVILRSFLGFLNITAENYFKPKKIKKIRIFGPNCIKVNALYLVV